MFNAEFPTFILLFIPPFLYMESHYYFRGLVIHGAQFDTDLVMNFLKNQDPIIIIIVNIIIY